MSDIIKKVKTRIERNRIQSEDRRLLEHYLRHKPHNEIRSILGNECKILSSIGNEYSKEIEDFLRKMGGYEGRNIASDADFSEYISAAKYVSKQKNWEENEYFTSEWSDRIELLMKYNMPENKSILDVGCGSGNARRYIQMKNISLKYFGLDYKKRNEDTIVCDLNMHEFPEDDFDVILCSGSIEYINDTDWFFEQMDHAVNQVLISYCTMERTPLLSVRRGNSWKSNLTVFEIVSRMCERGFILESSEILNEATVIYDFRRTK